MKKPHVLPALLLATALLHGCGGGGGGSPAGGPAAGSGTSTTTTSGSDSAPGGDAPGAPLAVRVAAAEIPVAAGTPCNAATQDNGGGLPWGTPAHGKAPEIVPFVNADGTLDVAWDDQGSSLIRIVRNAASSSPEAPIEVSGLGRLMGFARDAGGAMYVATSIEEDLSGNDPLPSLSFRAGVVQVIKLDASGQEQWRTDVTNAFADNAADETAALYSPMVAGTGRLAVGGGRVMLHFSRHNEWDAAVSSRHQLQMYIALDAAT
ncbi:MAG: hypothetical protein ABW051_07085, partial [Burkholderiaceae bacterium]